MKKEITVDKAIKRGNSLLLIVTIITLIAMFAAMFLFDYFHLPIWLALIVWFPCFAILLFLAWKKWIFWAFTYVQDVHELKKRLIMTKSISENSKFFKKIENCTEDNNKYWYLHLKFAQDNVFKNDITIPDETLIYHSKISSRIFIATSILLFAAGIFLLTIHNTILQIFGIVMLIVSVLRFYKEYIKLKRREPQIILNNRGIKTVKTDFYKWEEIKEEKFINNSSSSFLTYKHPRGEETINIGDLDISPMTLSKLLWIYNERNKLQNNNFNRKS